MSRRRVGVDVDVELPDVSALARTARVELDEAEASELQPQLERVLELFAELAGIDVEGVEPLTHPLERSCQPRDDKVVVGEGGASADAILAAADGPQLAEHQGETFYRAPAVLRRR